MGMAMAQSSELGWLQRPLAILATALLIALFPTRTFDLIAYALLFAHYFGAVIYHPWKRIADSGQLRPHLLIVIGTAILALAQFACGFPPIILYFGVHFVFTELYENRQPESKSSRVARGLFYSATYLLFMRQHLGLDSFFYALCVLCSLGLAGSWALAPSWRARLADLSLLAPLVAASFLPTRFTYILTYHVMLWWMIPVVRQGARVKFLKGSLALTAFFLVLILGSAAWNESLYWAWSRETVRFGYLHVSLTLVMSSLNPAAIRALVAFCQRKAADVV